MTQNAESIRVLKFLNNFLIGGTERQFVHVANGLDRSRFSVDIGCFDRSGPLLRAVRPGTPVHNYPLHGSFYNWTSIASQLRLLKHVRRRRYDIVHTYGWYPNVFAVPASRLARRPAIVASLRDAGAYMTPAKIGALKFACRLADCVLANSAAGRSWLIEQGVREEKIEVIRNGIAVPPDTKPRITNSIRAEFGIPRESLVCACIGRVVSGKGMEFYLRAARILVDRGHDIRFLMIGADSAERHCQSDLDVLARDLNLGRRLIFTGQRQDVPDVLRDVDMVVHPSLTEGLSNVILEAMAGGIPVVATRVGGNPELVEDGHTGFLVPAANAEAIADAITRLVEQPEMARAFGDRARQRVIEEFSIEHMLAKTEALYLRLIEQRQLVPGSIARREMPVSPAGKAGPR